MNDDNNMGGGEKFGFQMNDDTQTPVFVVAREYKETDAHRWNKNEKKKKQKKKQYART